MKNCQMKNCQKQFPSYEIIDGKLKNYQNRKYCFECSPIGKHKIRSRAKNIPLNENCDLCSKKLDSKAWANRKRCSSCQVKIHRIKKKIKAIELLGGKCKHCGWEPKDIYEIAAIEFHHPDNNKEYDISSNLNKKWESILPEIQKCIILCSNCHRINHTNRNDKLLEIILG